MKIAFCTCVQLGRSCIESVLTMGGTFELLITLNDNKARTKSGRIYLDDLANQHNIPLLKVNHINDESVIDTLKNKQIDWLFIIGWSQIASSRVLESVNKGVIGAHPTLLPEGRGRAAIPWAIIKQLNKTGVTFFKMDQGVDTGDILDQFEIPLSATETATELYQKVNEGHKKLITQIWPKIISNTIYGVKQDENKASYWEGRTPEDGELKSSMSVEEVDKIVRATTHPYPGAFIVKGNTKMIIWKGEIIKNNNNIDTNNSINFKNGSYRAIDYSFVSI